VGDTGTIIVLPDSAGINLAGQQNTWTLQVNASLAALPTQNINSVIFGFDAQFVAVGGGGLALYSPSGLDGSWSAGSAGSSDLFSVVFTPTAYLAVGAAGANVFVK
jgi:hypothetical protein